MAKTLFEFVRDDGAATALEYSLVLGIVVLGALGAFQYFGQSVDGMYGYVSSSVISVMPAG